MSRDALTQALARASADAAFRSQLQSNPESALAGYDLTPEERAALMRGDAGQLRALGVDARFSKTHEPRPWGDPAGDMGPFAG